MIDRGMTIVLLKEHGMDSICDWSFSKVLPQANFNLWFEHFVRARQLQKDIFEE